jgi:hypothetical protein
MDECMSIIFICDPHAPSFYLTGVEKTKTKKTLALQAKINTLAKLFQDDEINRGEYL